MVALMPTISTSSWTLMMPRSTRPVTHGTATGDREHVFDRHQERLVDGTNRLRNVGVQGLYQLLHGAYADAVVILAFQRHQRGTDDDRSVVARKS